MRRVKEAGIALNDAILDEMHMCGPYETLPYPPAPSDGPVYANAVVCGKTELSLEIIKKLLKAMEEQLGRRAEHKMSGKVVIDMDVVVYGDEICRRGEFEADYFKHGYELLVKEA